MQFPGCTDFPDPDEAIQKAANEVMAGISAVLQQLRYKDSELAPMLTPWFAASLSVSLSRSG